MSRIVDVVPLRAARQVTVFDGSRASEDTLGITEVRKDSRPGGTNSPAWSEVTREDTWEVNGQPIKLGAMFERQWLPQADGTETYGAWEYIGQADEVGDIFVPINIDRDRLAAPGQPMRRPEGSELILTAEPTGSGVQAPTRPAVGEQDLSPLTGLPMVDEAGQPVIVPAE